MTTYHLELDHPDWRHLADTHYEHCGEAIAAHDHIIGLPDGATRVVDELGFVHAVLYTPPVESPVSSDAVAQLAMELLRAEDAGVLDRSFFGALQELRGLLSLMEDRAMALAARGRCCIIVEDEPEVRRGIERMARTIGFARVWTCRSVDELRCMLALQEADPGALSFPDVVVSDYDLPGGTGVDVQNLVRRHAQQHTKPIFIAYSSCQENLDRMSGVRVLKENVTELDAALRSALSYCNGAPSSA